MNYQYGFDLELQCHRKQFFLQPQRLKSYFHEANSLNLDSTKARTMLGWQQVWDFDLALEKTAQWYRAWMENKEVISRQQLRAFVLAASQAKVGWA